MAAIDSGRLEMKTATTKETLTPPPASKRQPDRRRLGDPVEERSEHDPLGVVVRVAGSAAIDQPVAAEVDERPGAEAERGCVAAAESRSPPP